MEVDRQLLLQCLSAVSGGLSKSDVVEQSSCFVFRDGKIVTYNDEVACQIDSPLLITAAVAAAPLMALLQKLEEDRIDVELHEGELRIKGKARRAGVRCDAAITLPIENVPEGKQWASLHAEFEDAVGMVVQSVGRSDSEFILTCVHIAPKWLEACDNYQMTRYPLKTGFKTSILVRGTSLKEVVGLGMTEFSEAENWVHFRNPAGLIYSCRRYVDEYADLTELVSIAGVPATLPKGLVEAIDKAQVFSSGDVGLDQVVVHLRPGMLEIEGRGGDGWYQERKKILYEGAPLSFSIAPKLLQQILLKANDCQIAPGRVIIKGSKFTYVGCTALKSEVAQTAAV